MATAAVSITVDGRQHMAKSNRQGEFILSDLRPGAHELHVGRLGYAPLRHPIAVSRGRSTEVDIGLVPAPVDMVPIVATGTRLRRLEIRGPHSHRRCLPPTGDEVGDERDEAASSAGAIRLDDLQLNVI